MLRGSGSCNSDRQYVYTPHVVADEIFETIKDTKNLSRYMYAVFRRQHKICDYVNFLATIINRSLVLGMQLHK